MAEPEPERQGSYVPFAVQAAVAAQKSLQSAGVDTVAEVLSASAAMEQTPDSGPHDPEVQPESESRPDVTLVPRP